MPNRVVKPFKTRHLFLPFESSPSMSHVTAFSGCSYLQSIEASRKGVINGAMLETCEAPPKNLFAEAPDYNDCLDYF